MMRRWSVMAWALAATALVSPPAAHAERVRTVIPRSTVNYLSLPVADVKAFFRSEGFENKIIIIPGTTAIAAGNQKCH
jgi:ABC-type nitrate/sulfonate/bicarbonate transport system substrate-binding protein